MITITLHLALCAIWKYPSVGAEMVGLFIVRNIRYSAQGTTFVKEKNAELHETSIRLSGPE